MAMLGVCTLSASADISDNKVYRIVNVGYNHAMTANGAGNITASEINETDDAQLWVAEADKDGTGFYMRNYKTGYYMTSSRARSKAWQAQFTITPDDNKILMKFTPVGESYFINTVNATGKTDDEGTHGYAHENSSHTVVGWNVNTENTKWNLELQSDITPEDLKNKKSTWQSCVTEILPGRAYRIKNYHYGHSMAPKNRSLVGMPSDNSDINQVWIVEENPQGEGFFLRHYETGMVVTSPCTRENAWTLQDLYVPEQKGSAMYFSKKSSGFGISTISTRDLANENSNFTFAHENNQSVILGYSIGSNPSIWHFTLAEEITESDIAAKTLTWNCYKKNSIDSALAAIFSDPACTELTPEYAAKNPEELAADPNILALPEQLRPMVRKVLTGDWSETDPYNGNEWDSSHAKKFRVMIAEPFSDCGHAATLAGIQAYGDLNNPTGIVTDNGTVLYVMIDKDPEPGSTLNIAGRTGEGTPLVTLNNNSDGFPLRKGLNIIHCDKDLADMIVYYTVRTTNNHTRMRHVTDYDNIKIHIEGGSINGYFNSEGDELYTSDTNEDWLYYRERARHAMFTLLSKYNTLYIHFHDISDANGNKTQCLKSLCSPEAYSQGKFDLIATMKAWDEMYLAETLLMGLHKKEIIEAEKEAGRDYYDTLENDEIARDDYYKYFNNRHLGISLRECGFMNATWYRTAYNPSTISSIIREFPKGDMWGPAHEFGHLNQGPMNMAGCTEESNNVFSNVAMFYRGTHSSRADYPSEQRRRFNEGQNFHQHGTWGTTRMWFQLWLYYHYIGHDKKFYPKLYELLRTNPLRRTHAPGHDGVVNPMLAKDDILHFAKMACVAAGEDLTDFFEAWGFLVEQDGFYIGDYTSYTSYLSEKDIADWKAEISALAAEKGWEKNSAILFIDDRVGSDRQSYGFDKNKCGSMGGLKDFKEGAPVTGEYTFTLSGTTVKISGGEGGVGFIIHDSEGKLIGFANDPVFEVSPAAAEIIKSGNARFDIVCHDNNTVTVVDAVHNGSLEQRLKAMDTLLEDAEKIIARSDRKGLNPGFLLPETVAGLTAVYDEVRAKREKGEISEENNVSLYDALYSEYMEVKNISATTANTIPVTPGGIYVFSSNLQYPGKGISANNAGTHLSNVAAGDVDPEDEAQQWMFEPTDEENYYYIRNIKFNKYIGKAPADKAIVTLVTEPVKQLVVFQELGGFSISPLGSDHDSLHDDGHGRLTRWDSAAKASRWTLVMAEGWETKAALADLQLAVEKAEDILSIAGSVKETPEGLVGAPNEEYIFVTPDMLVSLHSLTVAAKEICDGLAEASVDDIKNLTEKINTAISELQDAINLNENRLSELIVKTRDLANKIGKINEEVVPIELKEELLYSNAPHKGSGADMFKSWNVLLDNNFNTYFHSNYENIDSEDGLDHYIRIQLPERSNRNISLILGYVTRKNNDSNWSPAEAVIERSDDGETWHDITTLKEELPAGSANTFQSAPLSIPSGTEYIRFMVNKNRRSASSDESKTAGGHSFFVLSELSLSHYNLSCEPLTDLYSESTEQILTEAMTTAYKAAQVLMRRDFGPVQYDAAYEELLPYYEKLNEIFEKGNSGVEDITLDTIMDLKDAKIYNLNGVRLNRIARPGLYIVNGKKVFIRQ